MEDMKVPRNTAAVRDLITSSDLGADEVVRGTRIAASEVLVTGGEIQTRDELTIIANIVGARPEYTDLGLDAGARCRIADFGMIGLLIRSSRNFSEGLTESIRFQDLCHPLPRSRQVRHGKTLVIDMDAGLLPPDLHPVLIDYQIAAIASVWSELGAGQPARTLELGLAGAPRPHADRYAELLGVRPTFGANRNRLVLDATPFDEPMSSAAESTLPTLREDCKRLLVHRHARVGVAGSVLDCLERRDGPSSLGGVADELAMSARSLRRALLAEGTSFQALDAQVRLSRAVHLLETTTLTLDQISSELGYSATPAFTYAFKRWTGKTPGAFRRAATQP